MFNKGSNPGIIIEYSGHKYLFGNDRKPADIPVEALISAYKSGHIHAHDLAFFEQGDNNGLINEIKSLKEENLALKKEVEELERKVKKNAGKK